MRIIKNRIRHTLAFKIIGLIVFTPLTSWVFGFEMYLISAIAKDNFNKLF
ncbi:chlorhexidine efflux transporter [Psychrobacter sp. M13]|nr:chlorhexidine efflux transporter [Psychrobacter sp. M13]WLP95479.1 chlorhexidine efflux transporter [Psychrobacter sp. M13]